MPTTVRRYNLGDQVIIDPTQVGANLTGPTPAKVVSLDTRGFCTTCHCTPVDPDHKGDGSLCCPGPWVIVEYTCDEQADHTHRETYAEHELSPAQ